MKTVYIVAAESATSGMFDWFPTQEGADKQMAHVKELFKNIEGETIYRGNLEIEETLSKDEITDFIDDFLYNNNWENAPLINKEVIQY